MKAKFGDFYIALISFFKNNPPSTYIIHVDGADKDGNVVSFTPFVRGESISYLVKNMVQFELVHKIHK